MHDCNEMSSNGNCVCPKCGKEMRRGHAFIEMDVFSRNHLYGMNPFTGINIPTDDGESKASRLMWRERTGRKSGWLIKSDEEETMIVEGRRCPSCGFLEFYAGIS